MKARANGFGLAIAMAVLALCTSCAPTRQEIRIDGSSDLTVQQSYTRMSDSLSQEQRTKLMMAIIQLNMIGISSAKEMLADPELRSPGPVRIKSRIAGLNSAEIIALAAKNPDVRVYVEGEEPGVPAELLTPLEAGMPTIVLTSTRWQLVSNVNGHIDEQILNFEPGGSLLIERSSNSGLSRWEQSGGEVRILINDRYSVSRGKFVDAGHMQGVAGNKVGSTWTWTAKRL